MDNNINIIENLKLCSSNKYYIELLEQEINKRVYWFGPNFKKTWNSKKSIKEEIKFIIKTYAKYVKVNKKCQGKSQIFSNAYFNLNDLIEKKDFEIIIPNWISKKNGNYIGNLNFQNQFNKLNKIILTAELGELLSKQTFELITDFIENVKVEIGKRNIVAGVFSNDLGFYERLFIDVFKQLKIPTFIFLHGLPGRYNSIDDNRTDYLLVWGKRIKENYIKQGVSENKIIVTGHPNQSGYEIKPKLKFSLENILVISRSINGVPSDSENQTIEDRSLIFNYLLNVQKVLSSVGVSSVRLRLHPSENSNWYSKTFDMNFFKIDKESLKESLNRSKLVIGPTSTVFLESILAGVNYLIFESESYYSKVDPFDGSNQKIPVAHTKSDFETLINNRTSVDSSVIEEYVSQHFDLEKFFTVIKSNI